MICRVQLVFCTVQLMICTVQLVFCTASIMYSEAVALYSSIDDMCTVEYSTVQCSTVGVVHSAILVLYTVQLVLTKMSCHCSVI